MKGKARIKIFLRFRFVKIQRRKRKMAAFGFHSLFFENMIGEQTAPLRNKTINL